MSSENTSKSLPFIEILAILLFVVGIIFIFVSSRGKQDQEREVFNALRFQNVSELADVLWKLSLNSTDYTNFIASYPKDVSCPQSTLLVTDLASFLVPEYFDVLPQDPSGNPYQVSFDDNGYVTVCTIFGEEEDGSQKTISITR